MYLSILIMPFLIPKTCMAAKVTGSLWCNGLEASTFLPASEAERKPQNGIPVWDLLIGNIYIYIYM